MFRGGLEMQKSIRCVTRRKFIATGSAGVMAAVAMPRQSNATQSTPTNEEQANIIAVNNFCATFDVPFDWEKMASYLTSDCKYRATQTAPITEGSDAIVEFLRSFGDTATAASFEIVDTWARGPVVVNDRVDRFVLPERSLDIPVVGVFYLVDGKISEWTDFVFNFEM